MFNIGVMMMKYKEWWDFRELLNILDIEDVELKKVIDDACDMIDDMKMEITQEII
jgi:hypothetical protein